MTLKMLSASWFFVYFFRRFRSSNAVNMGSVGQRAAKLPSVKLWKWFGPGWSQTRADCVWFDYCQMADLFVRPPTLTVSNFAALWPTEPKLNVWKDLSPSSICISFQEVGSILRVGLFCSQCKNTAISMHTVGFITTNKSFQVRVCIKLCLKGHEKYLSSKFRVVLLSS